MEIQIRGSYLNLHLYLAPTLPVDRSISSHSPLSLSPGVVLEIRVRFDIEIKVDVDMEMERDRDGGGDRHIGGIGIEAWGREVRR